MRRRNLFTLAAGASAQRRDEVPGVRTVNAWAYLSAVVLLAICGGCSGPTSFRVIDERTGRPLSGITATLSRKEGNIADFLLGLPAEARVVAWSDTDAGGRVAFRGIGAGHRVTFSIGSGSEVTA